LIYLAKRAAAECGIMEDPRDDDPGFTISGLERTAAT
jgi:hypothetical protein